MAELDARKILETLALRLRSKAKWECCDGYYSDEMESAKNAAMREVYEGIAGEIEELLLPDPPELCDECGSELDWHKLDCPTRAPGKK